MFELDSTVTWLIIGIILILSGFVINYLSDMRDNRQPENDKFLPVRDINSIRHERYNKNNWE